MAGEVNTAIFIRGGNLSYPPRPKIIFMHCISTSPIYHRSFGTTLDKIVNYFRNHAHWIIMKLGNLDNDVWPNLYGKILITKNINEPAASLIAFTVSAELEIFLSPSPAMQRIEF